MTKSDVRHFFKYSFFERIVNKWNELAMDIILASS